MTKKTRIITQCVLHVFMVLCLSALASLMNYTSGGDLLLYGGIGTLTGITIAILIGVAVDKIYHET